MGRRTEKLCAPEVMPALQAAVLTKCKQEVAFSNSMVEMIHVLSLQLMCSGLLEFMFVLEEVC